MSNNNSKYFKLFVLVAALPFMYGCGGGTGSLLSFLFGAGAGIGDLVCLTCGGGGGGGGGIATLVQPEPASMLLLGSGLAAMSYFKAKAGRRSK